MTTNPIRFAVLSSAVLVVLVAGGTWYARAATAKGQPAPTATAAQVFRCPMHPETAYDKPGSCPVCGMSLVPAEAGAPAGPSCGAGPAGGCCGGEAAAPTK